jgi:hypothetical protein
MSSPSRRRVTSRFGRSTPGPAPRAYCFRLREDVPAMAAIMTLAAISASSRTMPGGIPTSTRAIRPSTAQSPSRSSCRESGQRVCSCCNNDATHRQIFPLAPPTAKSITAHHSTQRFKLPLTAGYYFFDGTVGTDPPLYPGRRRVRNRVVPVPRRRLQIV